MARTLTPYALSSDLELRPFDAADPTTGNDLPWTTRTTDDGQVLDIILTGEQLDWAKLAFQLRADLPATEIERILPSSSDLRADTRMLISVRCPTTKLRLATELDFKSAGVWSGDLTLDRADVRRVVELHGFLVRTTSIPGGGVQSGKAAERGAIVAEGRTVRIHVDEVETSIKGAPMISWEDFTASDNSWRKEHSKDLYFFEADSEKPILWLNAWYTSFREVLHSADEKGPSAALRILSSSNIAQAVWLQMLVESSAAIEVDEATGQVNLPIGWRQDVLECLLPRMFPQAPSNDDRFRRAAEMVRSGDQVGNFLVRGSSGIQDLLGQGNLFQSSVRVLEEWEKE